MSLRTKLVLALALLSATATIAVGVASYTATARRLEAEIDRSLLDGAEALRLGSGPNRNTIDRPGATPRLAQLDRRLLEVRIQGLEPVTVQIVAPGGEVLRPASIGALPVGGVEQTLARAGAEPVSVLRDVEVEGEGYRLLTTPSGDPRGGALQLARSTAETERVLSSLRRRVGLAVLVVVAAAALVGWVIARQATQRLLRLTAAADAVAASGRLDVDVAVDGRDEAGRLGAALGSMLDALARSREAQRRLVQDAGHELRTPLTSLRTNIAVLARHDDLPAETRRRVLDDLDAEAAELSTLVDELVELATEQHRDEPAVEVDLGPLVERVADRTRRRTGRPVLVSTGEGTVVLGRPGALERAVSNLLDNAAKFDDGDGPLEVTVAAGRVEVCDRGPGIAEDDLPHVFDRFFRAVGARSRPGSGLGLAIVRDVAEAHGGRVHAQARPGGGACVGFTVPLDGPSAPT